MSAPEQENTHAPQPDPEITAIRSLIEDDARAQAMRAEQEAPKETGQPRAEIKQKTVARKTPKMRRRAPASAIQHTAPHIAQPAVPEEPKEPSRFALAGQRATDWVIFKVRTYRPERKSILLTSLVLLVLLKPFMMIGWSLVAAFALLLTFLFLGGDRFWRMVIVLFRAFARRNPSAARVVKLRAYVIARKWNRLMEWVPQGLADCISAPDLREMIAADARHEVALHDRLNRLNRDAAY